MRVIKWNQPKINMDKPMYQHLAALIGYRHREGYSWADSQRMALAHLKRTFHWEPN